MRNEKKLPTLDALDARAEPLAREWLFEGTPATVLAAISQMLASYANQSIRLGAAGDGGPIKQRARAFAERFEALVAEERATGPMVLMACATGIYEIAALLEEGEEP